MKILVTGATGLIGQAIVEALRKRNIPVNFLTSNDAKVTTQEGYQGYFWNPAEGEIDMDALKGVTHIINLAGATISKKWTSAYKAQILNSRIDCIKTLKNALEKLDSHHVEHLVSASAIGIYPNSLTTFYDEKEKEVDNSFLGEVVAKWEKEIDSCMTLNFKVSTIRIGLVLSANGGALPKMVQPINNYVGAAFGSGMQWQSWIHIRDLVAMFLFVVDQGLEGKYNGVAPNPVTNAKLTKELANILQKPLVLPNIPKMMMELLLGEMAYLLFASQRVSSKRIEKKGFVFTHHNIGTALEDFYAKKEHRPNSQETSYQENYS